MELPLSAQELLGVARAFYLLGAKIAIKGCARRYFFLASPSVNDQAPSNSERDAKPHRRNNYRGRDWHVPQAVVQAQFLKFNCA